MLVSVLVAGLVALATVTHGQQERIVYQTVDRGRYTRIWNELESSIHRYNEARKELGENLTGWPPWSVVSEPKEQRRRELYTTLIKEPELQARLYKQLRDEDR